MSTWGTETQSRHRTDANPIHNRNSSLETPNRRLVGNPGRHLFGCKRIVVGHHSFALQLSKIENCIVILSHMRGLEILVPTYQKNGLRV
jgi:hypothetical protein